MDTTVTVGLVHTSLNYVVCKVMSDIYQMEDFPKAVLVRGKQWKRV